MIILTDKKLVIPVGIAPNYAGAGNSDVKLQSKSVTITENGSKTLLPDSNYTGFSQVNITTNVANNPVLEDKNVEIIENGDYSFTPSPAYDGIGNFRLKVNVEIPEPIPVESVKTAYPSFENDVTVVPSEGYEAMSSVIVKKAEVNLQTKSVTINENGSTSFTPDVNFMGLSKIDITTNVELNPVLETRSEEITENGSYKFTPGAAYDGIGNLDLVVNVDVNDPTKVESSKTAYPSFEQDVTVTPSVGFDAMGTVIVKKAEPNLQDKTVDKASTSEIVLRADAGYQGLGTVTVAPIKTTTVTADPSTNVQEFSANTENNEYITNVTVNPVGTKTVTADPSTNVQEFSANTQNNEYITSVTVNPVGTKTVNLDPSTNVQTVNANVEGNEYITSVTVNPVNTRSINVDPSTNEQVVNAPENEYITSVTVNPVGTKTVTLDSSINVQTVNANVGGNEYITSVTVNPIGTKTVTVDPSTNSQTVNANVEGNEYITSVTVNPVGTKTVTVDPSTNSQEVNANVAGNEYISTVTVNPVGTKNVTADPSTNRQTFNANVERNEYISTVTVNPVSTKTVTADPSTNVQEFSANTQNNEYITSVTVNPVVTKTVNIDSSTNAQTVNANTEGNEYITSVTVNPVKTKSLSITPSLVEQTFTAEQELYKTVNVSAVKYTTKTYDASTNTQTYDYAKNNSTFIKKLTINKVTSSIDPNIVPGNIAKGVSILGVQGTLEGAGNVNGLVNGPALTIKFKVKDLLSTKRPTTSVVNAAGKSGYIYIFNCSSSETLANKGVIAYALNGELHKITDQSDNFIHYTKKTSGYDDIVVDVYVDFEQSGRYCASKEGADYETSPYYGSSYNYLPNIIAFDAFKFYNNCTVDKTIVRRTVNAIGKDAFLNVNKDEINYGMLIFEPSADGIKRFHENSFLYIEKFDIYIYGNMAEFPSLLYKISSNSKLLEDSYAKVYGDIKNYPDNYLTDVNLLSTKLHGIIKTVSNTPPKLYKVTGTFIIDYYEGCTENDYDLNGRNGIIIPASCTSLFINKFIRSIGTYNYSTGNAEIVFFGTTPPSLPKVNNFNQQKISTKNPDNDSHIKRVFIPAGSNYDSILGAAPYRPQVIEFTPITDLSTISGAGYYGYTAPDGSHTLLNVAST